LISFPPESKNHTRLKSDSPVDMLAVVAGLSRREFYKSMTTLADHRIWQDVYHADTPMKKLVHIKLTLRDGAPVIQFKEK
jgi:motility quorum-sensing regulator/GCU-specific mRNA interferase toxin